MAADLLQRKRQSENPLDGLFRKLAGNPVSQRRSPAIAALNPLTACRTGAISGGGNSLAKASPIPANASISAAAAAETGPASFCSTSSGSGVATARATMIKSWFSRRSVRTSGSGSGAAER